MVEIGPQAYLEKVSGMMRRRRLAAVLALALCLGSLVPVTAGVGAASPAPTVRLSVLRGHGELALVVAGRLYLAGGSASRVLAVAGPGAASYPQWSHDGQWLAYTRTLSTGAGYTQLWVVRANGTDNHRVPVGTSASLFVGATAQGPVWSPTADLLATAATTLQGRPAGLWVASPDAHPLTVRSAAGRRVTSTAPVELAANGTGPIWSPDGRTLAYTVTLPSANPVARSDALYTRALLGAPERHLVAKGDGLIVASWWPEGHGLLYWVDPQHSASLAADGLDLDTIDLSSGRREPLAVTLVDRQLISWGSSDLVAIGAGAGREAWTGKVVMRCMARIPVQATQACITITRPAGPISFAPAWSRAGLAFIEAKDLGSKGWGASTSAAQAWRATNKLWFMPTGKAPRAVAGAGSGVMDPVWSADAKYLMVVRSTTAYLVDPARGTSVQVATGIRPYLYPLGYYGQLDEPEVLAWYSGQG